jgi:tetratricopeptide (TPR) repeat protein
MLKLTRFIFIGLLLNLTLNHQLVKAATTASEYRQLGLALRQQGKYSQAITAMQKSVELEPKNITGRVNLGWTLHLAGREKEAAISLWEAILQKPLFVPAYNALGIVYLVDGNVPAAATIHTWAIILKLDNEIAYYNLSLALHRLQIYNLAVICANRAFSLEPNNPHPLVAGAIAYWDLGDKISAKQAYIRVINLDSRYSDRPFLNHLQQAAFTSSQIQTVEKLLNYSSSQN